MLTVSGNDLLDDCESKPGALLIFATGTVNFVKAFPYPVQAGFGDSDTVIFNGYEYFAVFFCCLNRDRRMIRTEFDRIT